MAGGLADQYQTVLMKMWGLGLDSWNLIMLSSLAGAALAAFALVVSTRAVIVLQKSEQEQTKLEFDRYKLDADKKISEANARTEEAKLALEKLKTPRTLGPDRQQLVFEATRQYGGQRYRAAVSQAADDGLAFWESIYITLQKAGWVYLPPPSIGIGNPPAGIPIAAMPGVEIRFDPAREQELAPAALALGNALHANGTVVAVNKDNANVESGDILLIVIGARVPPS